MKPEYTLKSKENRAFTSRFQREEPNKNQDLVEAGNPELKVVEVNQNGLILHNNNSRIKQMPQT